MREKLIAELVNLKTLISVNENAVFVAYKDVQDARKQLQLREDAIILGKDVVVIDGKNAEIRAAQIREATAWERLAVQEEERVLESKKLDLDGLRSELRINLALVELVKGVA